MPAAYSQLQAIIDLVDRVLVVVRLLLVFDTSAIPNLNHELSQAPIEVVLDYAGRPNGCNGAVEQETASLKIY